MKIISWNVNGLRAVCKKGFLDWLRESNPEIVCLQEIKVKMGGLIPGSAGPKGYHPYFNSALKPGYSGVAVFTKEKPQRIEQGLGMERFDREGRMLRLEYPDFILINLYLPHGGRDKENLDYKLGAYNRLLNYLRNLKNENVILTGDFNVAHEEIDLTRPKQNQNNIMFTQKEREQIDKIIELGFTDTFRRFNRGGGHYTWWPYGFDARKRNLGWRIDYIFVSESLISKVKDTFIFSEARGSDHCPVGIEIEVK